MSAANRVADNDVTMPNEQREQLQRLRRVIERLGVAERMIVTGDWRERADAWASLDEIRLDLARLYSDAQVAGFTEGSGQS